MHNISYDTEYLNCSKIDTTQIHRNIVMWFRYVSVKPTEEFHNKNKSTVHGILNNTGNIDNTGETKYLFTMYI